MSIKTKLTSLITTFILLCSLLTVGVFAVKNTTFNVGGDIVFNVQGIEATITRGECTGFTADKTIGNEAGNILSDITLDNTMSADDVADAFSSWSGLNLAFDNTTTATIKLTITNTADEGADNYLDITALADATTKNNAKVTVVNDAGGITALLEPQQSASFTITFSVIDDEYSASLEGFSVNFDMQKKVLADFDSYDADSRLSINCNTTAKTASVTGNNITEENTEIEIPKYVKSGDVVCAVASIGDSAFEGCENLTSITIPYTVTSIEGNAFMDCDDLKSITIPNSVTSIGDSAFSGCGLVSIEIPSSITRIEGAVFAYCTNLTSITIPDSVTSIGGSAFMDCYYLASITIPDSVTSIGPFAFSGCGLKSIEIPSSITRIETEVFSYCDLTSITIPDSVTSIGSNAFLGCTNLTSITIPDSVTSIEKGAFEDCVNLTTINYTGTQEQWNALVPNLDDIIFAEEAQEIKVTINYNYKG